MPKAVESFFLSFSFCCFFLFSLFPLVRTLPDSFPKRKLSIHPKGFLRPLSLQLFLLLAMLISLLAAAAKGSVNVASRAAHSSYRGAFVGPSRTASLSPLCMRFLSSGSPLERMDTSSPISASAGREPGCSSNSGGNSGSGNSGKNGPECLSLSASSPAANITQHPSFEVLGSHYVNEYSLFIVNYLHKKTGAKVVSLTSPETETEKAFMVAVRTPIEDSTGAPHVIEHCVLMGSDKYPLKEPFVALMKSSMYTYMNALTYPDRTCYPVASVNIKDFYNLASVYMDAVFRPKAVKDHLTLRQEGWRFELTPKETGKETENRETEEETETGDIEGEDFDGGKENNAKQNKIERQIQKYQEKIFRCLDSPETCELKIQGVVLNEMKGVYSSPDSLHARLRQRALFPQLPHYSLDSGGDPKTIPNLTFDAFKKFYQDRYYPANARIYFWGADDVKTRLDFVDKYFEGEERREGKDTTIGTQVYIDEPRYIEEPYPASSSKLEDFVSVSWVLDPVKPEEQGDTCLLPDTRMALQILSHLLLGTTASPLYKALTESNIGKSVLGSGVSLDMKHAIFSAGLKGIPQKEGENVVASVEEVILGCLRTLAEEGFSQDAIDASVNTVEFSLRELNTGTFPKGLAVILDMATESNYDRDPIASVAFQASLDAVKAKLRAGEPVFQDLIKRYLLNNQHRVTLRLKADPLLETKEREEETQKLAAIQRGLTKTAIEDILKDQVALKRKQLEEESEETLKTLPMLKLEDVAEADNEIPYAVSSLSSVPLITHELQTSGIVYIEVYLSLADIPLKDLPLLRLFSRLLTEAGTKDLSPSQLQHLIGRHTGGLWASIDFRSFSDNPRRVAKPYDALGFLVLSGKAFASKSGELLSLMHRVLETANLSSSRRSIEIIKESLAATESSFNSAGHRVALRRIVGAQTATGYATERTAGVSYRDELLKTLKEAETNWEGLERRLESIRTRLFRKENLLINLTGDKQSLQASTEGPGGEALRGLVAAVPVGSPAAAAAAAAAATTGDLINPKFRERGFDREPLWVKEIKENGLLTKTVRDALLVPTKVNFVCQGGRMSPPGSVLRGEEFVVSSSIGTHHLWKRVREVGGAYGSNFVFDATGLFCFSSYRDPQLINTLKAYKDTPQFLKEWAETMKETDVNRAVISVLRDLDAPIPNDQKGTKSFWQLIARQTQKDRKEFRQEILKTTPASFVSFAAALEKALTSADGENVAFVGSEDSYREAMMKDNYFNEFNKINLFDKKENEKRTAGEQGDEHTTQVASA